MCFASGGGRGRRYLEHGSLSGISAKVNPFLFQRQNANAIAAERIIRFSFYRNRDLPILKEKIARHASIGEYECSGNSSTHKVFTPLPNQVSFCFSLRFVHGSRLLKYSKRTAPDKKPNKANNFSDATCIATDDLRERVKNVHFYILQVRHAPLCACVPYHLSVCDTLEQHCWLHSWFSFSLCRRKRRNRKTRFKFRLQWVVLFRCTFVNTLNLDSNAAVNSNYLFLSQLNRIPFGWEFPALHDFHHYQWATLPPECSVASFSLSFSDPTAAPSSTLSGCLMYQHRANIIIFSPQISG